MSRLAPEDNMPADLTSQISEKLKLASLCVSGSFGVVHRCTIETSEGTTEVAVKVFKVDLGRAIEKNEKAMRRELLVWFRLKHRTIVPLLGTALIESPFPALVSKWMPSGTLYVYLEEATILTASAKVGLTKGVADGLQYLHSENVVHGDLHPANVLIDCSGNPRLIDFGLATVVGDAELQLSMTTVSRSLDPRWRAPEVIGIDSDLDPERPTFMSDIYSFGGIMFFVISGERPWKKKQPHHIYVELSNKANPARPDNILDNHWDLIQRCWSWNPKDRPKAIEVFESICITGLEIEDLSKQPNPHGHPSTSRGQLERGRSSSYAPPPLSCGRTYDRDIRPLPSRYTQVDHSPGQDVELRRMETFHDSRQQPPISSSAFNAPTLRYAWERDEPESQIRYPQPLYIGQNFMRSSSSSSISNLRDSSRMPSPALSDLHERIVLETHLEALDLCSSASSQRGITAPEQGQQSLPPPPPPSPSPPPPPQASISKQIRSLKRNVVIFGDSGSGRSSVINAIAQTQPAKTSSSATGCTFAYERHTVEISGQTFVLFDTAGLNEGTAAKVPAAKVEKNLKNLLNELMSPKSDGIGLLVYCVRSTSARRALLRNYHIFYSGICRKKVPIVVAVTGLENELDMESWWDANGKEFTIRGMHFEDHACVTTLRKHSGIPDVFTRRIEESSETLRNLLVKNCSDWAVDDSWFKQCLTAVQNLISDSGNSERSLPSTLIIYDPSRVEEVQLAPCIRGTLKPYFARIGGDTYQVHRVSAPDLSSSHTEKRPEGDLLMYYVRADEPSAARQKFHVFYTAYRGNMVPVVVVVKGLDDCQAANQWVEKYIMYDGAGHLFSAFAPAEEPGDDSLKQQAEQELQVLIRQACLVRSERKVKGKLKRLARRVKG